MITDQIHYWKALVFTALELLSESGECFKYDLKTVCDTSQRCVTEVNSETQHKASLKHLKGKVHICFSSQLDFLNHLPSETPPPKKAPTRSDADFTDLPLCGWKGANGNKPVQWLDGMKTSRLLGMRWHSSIKLSSC